MSASAAALRALLAGRGLLLMPCCYDALSARLVERAGFKLSFLSGFAVSAARLGLPDAGLIGYAEMLDQGRDVCAAVSIPVIGDADTGYGNALNVQRSVRGYAAAGFAGIMIEDQVWPKRCGHTPGKQVVDRGEALSRIRAAVDARDAGADLVLVARTDARGPLGLSEALWRGRAFAELGADVVFVEAPHSEEEMARLCAEIPGPKMANLVEGGDTPLLAPGRLAELGFQIAAYPLTLLLAAARAQQRALAALRQGVPPEGLLSFRELQELVGFPEYDAALARYAPAEPARRD